MTEDEIITALKAMPEREGMQLLVKAAVQTMTEQHAETERLRSEIERLRQVEASLSAIDKELRGKVNDPRPPIYGPFGPGGHKHVTTYGLVTGLLAERDRLRELATSPKSETDR